MRNGAERVNGMPNKPQPAFAENNVPVVFAANDQFVPYMATMMYSVMVHANPQCNYDFLVLHTDISPKNDAMLHAMLGAFPNVSLRLIDVSAYTSSFSFYTANREDFSEEAYYRLLIPEVMEGYDKVLYLDGDMVALADVAELYQTDLGENLVASSRDLCGLMSYYNPLEDRRKYRDAVLKLKNPNDYFITGMLLFNVPAFRAAYPHDYLLEFAASRDWLQHDQDVLNVLCEGRTKLVSASWDVIKPELYQRMPAEYRRELDDSIEHPKIVHFGGAMKPWVSLDAPFGELFWRYAAQTPYIQEIIRRRIYLDKPPFSVRGAMEEEFREGKVGARYIVRFLRAWLSYKLGRKRA